MLSENNYVVNNKLINQVVYDIMNLDNKTKEELMEEVRLLRDEVEKLRKEVAKSKNKKERLQSSIDAIPLPIFYKDANGLYSGCNKTFEDALGIKKEDIIGKSVYDLSPKHLADTYKRKDDELFEKGGIQNYITKVKYSDDSYHDIMFNKSVFKNNKGEIDGIVGIMIDVTEKIKADINLSKRLNYEKALSHFSQELLKTDIDLYTAIENSIKHLLDPFQSNYIYVYKNTLDENNKLITDKISAVCLNEKNNCKKAPPDRIYYKSYLDRWHKLLSSGQPIKGTISTFPENERQILALFDTASLLILPIVSEEKWYGFIAFKDKEQREWSEEDIRLLQTSADMLATYFGVKQYEEDIKKSKAEYQTIVENQTELIAKFSPKTFKLTFVNEAVCKFVNISKEELFKINISDFYKKEDKQDIENKIRAINFDNPVIGGNENQFIMPSGEKKWFKWSISGIFYEDKDLIEYHIIATDITKLKETEYQLKESVKEKEVLIKEIHHRVKNNLQIITSILNLQARAINDKSVTKIFKETRLRINAMGLVYEKLYQSKNLAKLDFSAYIESLIVSLYISYKKDNSKIELNTDIKADLVDIDIVNPCGLIVNELISNSLTHAFPDDMKGEINIKFYQDNEYITLIISDNGIGMPMEVQLDNISSLGLDLVLTLVEQLRGDIHINRNNGTEFIITFPITKKYTTL
jgi:PAS domain S-box-containing protein